MYMKAPEEEKHRTSLHKTSVLLRQNLRTFAQRSPMFCHFRSSICRNIQSLLSAQASDGCRPSVLPDGTRHLFYLLQVCTDILDVLCIVDSDAQFTLEDTVLRPDFNSFQVKALEGDEHI